MEEKITKNPLRIAIIAGVSTFIGFSIIFPATIIITGITSWKDLISFIPYFLIMFGFFLISGTSAVGFLEASILGVITYYSFKFLAPDNLNKKQLKHLTITVSIICAAIGVLSFSPADRIVRELHSGKEHVGTVDTNRDGKPDKWVHDNIYDQTVEVDYDTNFDGKPDVWEYLKDSKVYKKEIDTDFDGKPDKVENIK